MSMHSPDDPSPRRRLSRDERQRQLLEVAWRLVREEGTEALTLGRLAEQAGVTKPVVYDHFGTRAGLLAALYQDYDLRQTALMEAALEASEATEGQRLGAFFADQPPGHLEQLALALVAGQAAAWRRVVWGVH